MSRPINVSDSLTFNPTGYGTRSNISNENSSYPWSRGYNSTSNTSSYARIQLSSSNTTTDCYFNYTFSVSGIPSNATITSVACVARVYVNNRVTNGTGTGAATIQLYCGTTAKGSAKNGLSTSAQNITISNTGSWTVAELSDMQLRLTGRRSSTNNSSYFYFYGANVTITYSVSGTEYEITSTLATDKVDSISSEGQTWVYEGNDYELEIYGSSLEDVSVTDNDVDVTDFLVQHEVSNSGNASAVLGEYTLVSGSFNGSGATFFQGRVGQGENASTTTSNYYSGGSGTITVFTYKLQFSSIPSNATITRLYVNVNGHAESTSNSNEYMCAQIYVGSTAISSELNFKSVGTSNSTQTIEATSMPTVSQLSDLKLQCRLGYYGGAINGATCYIEYTLPTTGDYYWTYSLSNVQADHVIVVGESYSGPFNEINVRIYASDTDTNTKHKLVKPGDNFTLEIYRSSLSHITVKDNGTNVTSSITGSNPTFYYALSNISIDHSIEIVEDPWYEITCESTYADASVVVSSNKVYENGNFTVTVNVSNISLVKVKDNGVDISLSLISSGVYRTTISNVNEDHEIVVVEANSWTVTSMSNTPNATIDPSGVNSVLDGNSQTFSIYTNLALENIIVKDNGNDVTSQLEYISGTDMTQSSDSFVPSSFDSTNSTYSGIYNNLGPENALSAHTDSNRVCVYSNTGANAESYLYYAFSCPIPRGATITSVTCIATASVYGGDSGNYFSVRELQLCNGTTPMGTAVVVTGSGSTSSTHTIDGGSSWTSANITNVKLRFKIVRGSDYSSDASFSLWGATLTVSYSTGSGHHYDYTINNITTDHTINVFEVFVPEEEDENKTYYSVTISAINATTTPSIGTIRVEEGEDISITVSPSEQQVTLVTDNGRDISGYLNFNEPTYTVTTQVSGASYGFNLDQSTGYYVSTNNGVAQSASVARLNLSLPVRCLVTIEYINYAEENYDYGMFGKIDTSVAIDGLTASSGSSSPSDSTSNYQLAMASNSQSTQTITYTVESGDHFIDIKYGKDNATDAGNDSLQWKVSNIQPLESLDNTYTIHSIDEDHNLTFVFGEVIYYTVESSGTNSRLFPNGEFVVLPNDLYSLVIIPNASNYKPTVHDNGRDVTGSLAEIEKGDTFYYQYTIKKTTANHVIIVECEQVSGLIFVKSNGTYVAVSKVFIKSNGSWVEQNDYTNIFEQGKLYVHAT